MTGSFLSDAANQVLFLVILAMSLNLLLGFAGQLSMATAAFYGLGGYTCAVMTASGTTLSGSKIIGPGWPFAAGLACAVVLTLLFGLLLALPAARRVRGEYLILLTLAFQFLFSTVASTWVAVTGGPNGIVVPAINLFGWEPASTDQAFWLFLVLTLVVGVGCWWVGASPWGRLLRGIREDEEAVQSLGKPTVWPKSLTFGLTAAIAGGVGAFSVAYTQFVAPGTYDLDLAILVAACVALGGPGNVLGSAVAAVVIGGLRPFLENVGGLSSDTSVPWQSVIYGAILVLGMTFRPQGVIPEGTVLRLRGRGAGLATAAAGGPLVHEPPTPASEATEHRDPDRRAPAVVSPPEPDVEATARDATATLVAKPRNATATREPTVQARGMSKAFGGLHAVEGVDLDLYPGEILALIGPNGAGKTTVFNLLTGAIRPDEGTVRLKGEEITGTPPRHAAERGMVRYFQDVRVFAGMSVRDNVAIAVPGQPGESCWRVLASPRKVAGGEATVREEARRNLEYVGIERLADRIVADLPFGSQKLVAFARSLATGADVLLLDEPTAGVDVASRDAIIALVRQLARAGKAICFVEHSLHVVTELADRVVFMDAGRVIARGTVDEITRRQDLIDLYFGT
jgi:branched-chain amino acid transport system permease protein